MLCRQKTQVTNSLNAIAKVQTSCKKEIIPKIFQEIIPEIILSEKKVLVQTFNIIFRKCKILVNYMEHFEMVVLKCRIHVKYFKVI